MSDKKLLKKILKPGATLKANIINPNDPEIIASIKKCQEEQERILESKKIDYEKLKARITI